MSLGRAGITPDDERSFDSFKYIDIKFDEAKGMLPNLTTTTQTNPGRVAVEKSKFERKYEEEVIRRRLRRNSS